MRSIIVISTLLLLAISQVAVGDPAITLQRAFDEYGLAQLSTERNLRIEKFKRAQQLFQNAADQLKEVNGVANAALYANLGNAALQAEDLGAAVLAFRRTLVLDSGHVQANQNLTHARGLLASWVPRPDSDGVLDSFFFWHDAMPAGELASIASVFFLLAAFSTAAAIRWRSAVARNLAFLPALLWLGLSASLIFGLVSEDRQQAVIVQGETIARAADSMNAAKRFNEPLPAGTEVEVLEVRDRWAKIQLFNGRSAWVARVSYALVDDDV